MRLFENASLMGLVLAVFALMVRTASTRVRRGFVGVTLGMMALMAWAEGVRWQLVPAHALAAVCVVLVLLPRDEGRRARSGPLRALGLTAAVLALAVAVVLPVVLPVPRFERPEGPHPVGTVTFEVEDAAREDSWAPGRPRRLMVQAWYPADASAARTRLAPYLPQVARTGPALAHKLGLPSFFLNHFAYAVSHSHDGVPFAASLGRVPVILFSHGAGGFRGQNTTTFEELASRGSIVVSVDHTGDAAAVVFPDGAVVLKTPEGPGPESEAEAMSRKAAAVRSRAADVRRVAEVLVGADEARLPEPLRGHVDAARLGVFGHSLGGSTAVEVCRTDARFLACASLDGYLYGEAEAASLAQPFLLVRREPSTPAEEEDVREQARQAFLERLRGPGCRVQVARARHSDFTDLSKFSPVLPYLLPSQVSQVREEALRGSNQVVAAFFDAALRGDSGRWAYVRLARPLFSATCSRVPGP
jgi:dienelactone hydrolase